MYSDMQKKKIPKQNIQLYNVCDIVECVECKFQNFTTLGQDVFLWFLNLQLRFLLMAKTAKVLHFLKICALNSA